MARLKIHASALLLLIAFDAPAQQPPDRAAWMKNAHFGIMNHYLADWIARRENIEGGMTVERWNEMIDRFAVDAHARQVEATGARYVIFTIGQNSGYFCSPNAAYERIVGVRPSRCSRRDLIADIAAALHKRNIRLIAYLPAGAPAGDRVAREKLQWQQGSHSNREFQKHWEAIITEWSTRWGDRVAGWWFDGCYWPNTMYRGDEPPNFASFAASARSGNRDSAIAFNPGVVYRTISVTPHEDYVAGEIDLPDRWSPKRHSDGNVDGVRIHFLSYLGERWGSGAAPRFTAEQALSFTQKVWDVGGAVTWDVPIETAGTMPKPFLEHLKAIGSASRAAR